MNIQNSRDWDLLLQRGQLTVVAVHEGQEPLAYWVDLLEETLDALIDPRIFPGVVDIRCLPELGVAYRILRLPTVLIFKRGEVVERLEGRVAKRKLVATLSRHLEPFLFGEFTRLADLIDCSSGD